MIKNLRIRLQKFYYSSAFVWLLFAVGILLRLRQYAFNRSLWIDEAAVAVNLVGRSWSQLFEPLLYGQVAPLGFFLTEKLAIQVLGPSEYALRLFPLIAGILAMFVFHRLSVKLLEPAAVPLALALFAIAQPLVYFSSEVKQYSVEVLVTLVILGLSLKMLKTTPKSSGQVILYGLWGAIPVWFSFPSAFALAGTALVLARASYLDKKRVPWPMLAVFALWWVSVVLSYFFSKRYVSQVSGHMQDFWDGGFMPLIPSPDAAQWYMRAVFNTFEFPGGIEQTGLAVVAFVAGVVSFRLHKKKNELWLLLAPIAVALAASALRLYPFADRLILYLVPLLILLIAAGAVLIRQSLARVSRLLGAAFIVVLLVKPVMLACLSAVSPITREEVRPAFVHMKEHWQPGDVLYVYNGAEKAFLYYAAAYGFDGECVMGLNSRDNLMRYIEDIGQLQGRPRVWILFSHSWVQNNMDERAFIIHYLDQAGAKRLDAFKAFAKGAVGLGSSDSAVYLYDLSQPF